MKFEHAYRVLKVYSERNISGKDCSRLDIDEAIKTVLPYLAEKVDKIGEEALSRIRDNIKNAQEEFEQTIKNYKESEIPF